MNKRANHYVCMRKMGCVSHVTVRNHRNIDVAKWSLSAHGFFQRKSAVFMKACVNISLSTALVVKRVSFSSVHGTPSEWSRLSIVRVIFSFSTLEQLMHEMGSCVTKVDARPGMSENYANYYGVKMHHSETSIFIQETSEKGKNQIQDHV